MQLKYLEARYPGIAWRFGGLQPSVKHAFEITTRFEGEIGENQLAVCGRTPVWFSSGWFGTGTQEETEKLDTLRECKACMTKLGEGSHVAGCPNHEDGQSETCECWCHL